MSEETNEEEEEEEDIVTHVGRVEPLTGHFTMANANSYEDNFEI